MPFRLDRLTAALALAGCANFVQAAGFALIEQNASGIGNAYAGQAAAATDASTIFFNPAGMTYLPDRQVVMAGHLILPHAEFAGTVAPAIGGGNGGDAGGLAFVPNAYFAFRLTPDVHLGVGMNAPFGLATEYDATWKGRTQAIKSELKTINLNPSIAWRASDTLSFGAGLSIQYAEATLTSATNLAIPPSVGVVKGDDYGWGFNLGALWQPSETTRIGIAYRSEVDYTLEGGFKVDGATFYDPVFADATLPDSASLSIFHRLSEKWDVLADVSWTGWSDFYELRIVRANGAVVSLTEERWDDTFRFSVGANYRWSERLTLRGGVAFDETPVSDTYRTARIPDEDRTWIALGVQYRLSTKSVLDVGYAHLFVKDARIRKTETGPVTLTGSYDASVDILSAQMTLNF
ncbi:MAG: outer membrane protein transport protein [Pseudomonadota bacterium]